MTTTGTEVLCIGFNTRPIARGLSEAGYRPVVIDYFGDLDIRPYVVEGHYFLEESDKPKDPEHFKTWALETLDEVARAREGKTTLILPGSGFDDDPDAWRQFARLGRVLGSSPDAVARARDLGAISRLLKGTASPFLVPETKHVLVDAATVPAAAAHEVASALVFPVLAKRTRTAGGAGIELVQRAGSLEQVFQHARDGLNGAPYSTVAFNVQEFVGGAGARDASVLALGERVVCKTLQAIGDEKVHAPRRFSYCGNTIPLDTKDVRLDHAIEGLVMGLHRDFGLKGLYGIDLVLSTGKVYIVEINPRVPGSTELASVSVGRNLLGDHVASFLSPGSIPDRYVPARNAIKRILFAAKDFTMPGLDGLSITGEIHDITPPGTQVLAGMPVVTYTRHGPLDAADEVATAAGQDIKNIYAFLERDTR